MASLKVCFTQHAIKRIKQRHLTLNRVYVACMKAAGLFSNTTPLRFKVGETTLVAAKRQSRIVVITAW